MYEVRDKEFSLSVTPLSAARQMDISKKFWAFWSKKSKSQCRLMVFIRELMIITTPVDTSKYEIYSLSKRKFIEKSVQME